MTCSISSLGEEVGCFMIHMEDSFKGEDNTPMKVSITKDNPRAFFLCSSNSLLSFWSCYFLFHLLEQIIRATLLTTSTLSSRAMFIRSRSPLTALKPLTTLENGLPLI